MVIWEDCCHEVLKVVEYGEKRGGWESNEKRKWVWDSGEELKCARIPAGPTAQQGESVMEAPPTCVMSKRKRHCAPRRKMVGAKCFSCLSKWVCDGKGDTDERAWGGKVAREKKVAEESGTSKGCDPTHLRTLAYLHNLQKQTLRTKLIFHFTSPLPKSPNPCRIDTIYFSSPRNFGYGGFLLCTTPPNTT